MRRALAIIAAVTLAAQAVGAVALFAAEDDSCGCPMAGAHHHCDCADCARHRNQAAGNCSLGGCASDSSPLLLTSAARPFLPAAAPSESPAQPSLLPMTSLATPPLVPEPDVPTPPPLRV